MPEHFGGHLTFEDRCEIARALAERQSFAVIARSTGVSPSTITREIRRARIDAGYLHARQQACLHYRDCKVGGKCGSESCNQHCKSCRHFACGPCSCTLFAEDLCPKVTSSPLCCNGCAKRARCSLRQFFYRAKEAQQFSERLLKESRSQITLSPEELKVLTLRVKELLALGQSPAHIWRTHKDEFGISERTFYRHLSLGYYDITGMQLPRKSRYKPRRVSKNKREQTDFTCRRYADFMNLDEQERLSVVQVDSVEGIKSDKQAILTLHFVRFAFQIPLLLAEQTSVWVVKAFDALEQMCEGNFSKHFSLILTDRGSEFLAYEKLEHARDGHKRCRVYYCDPGRADQKGACEKNHEEIRKILPKKTSFELLTPVDMATIASHINSYSRKSLGGKTPLDLAATVLPQSLLDSLGIQKVDPDKVNLTPELLNLSLRN